MVVNYTNLVPNELFQQLMSSDGEQEAREKHAQRCDNGSREGVAKRSVHVRTLETHERGEDNQGCRQDIANGDSVKEDALGEPRPHQDGFNLYERDGRVRAAKRERAGHQTQHEEGGQGRRLGYTKGQRHGRGHAPEDNVECVTDVL